MPGTCSSSDRFVGGWSAIGKLTSVLPVTQPQTGPRLLRSSKRQRPARSLFPGGFHKARLNEQKLPPLLCRHGIGE
jgi:hypothetical protein